MEHHNNLPIGYQASPLPYFEDFLKNGTMCVEPEGKGEYRLYN